MNGIGCTMRWTRSTGSRRPPRTCAEPCRSSACSPSAASAAARSPTLIAAAAEELDVTVLHYDADFDAISAITGQRCEWVVPAGTVA